jgi:hypothetical protein
LQIELVANNCSRQSIGKRQDESSLTGSIDPTI